jgi:hypothetical protein
MEEELKERVNALLKEVRIYEKRNDSALRRERLRAENEALRHENEALKAAHVRREEEEDQIPEVAEPKELERERAQQREMTDIIATRKRQVDSPAEALVERRITRQSRRAGKITYV